ncbi:hypothetical protein GALL_230740 [mine drainage metagenome]|uniref:Uncharacterized protein n=1 Tax=mine drainage metagenome TaxID=410659 RepID=A0A1J5RZP1_9ZZZZ
MVAVCVYERAIDTAAATRVSFYAKQSDGRAANQERLQRVALAGVGPYRKVAGIVCLHETWSSCEDRSPWPSLTIQSTYDDERKLFEERLLLRQHESADVYPTQLLGAGSRTRALLRGSFSFMEGIRCAHQSHP